MRNTLSAGVCATRLRQTHTAVENIRCLNPRTVGSQDQSQKIKNIWMVATKKKKKKKRSHDGVEGGGEEKNQSSGMRVEAPGTRQLCFAASEDHLHDDKITAMC